MPLDYPIAAHTLPNGLRVLVSPDHTVPIVAVNLWVGVGSGDELVEHTGFAHLFEHLMFQGSRQVKSGEHFALLMAQGAHLNATTWFDRTNYFETQPRGAYQLALWLEADRHGYLLDALTQANLDNQRDVVKEEKRQRYDNQPYGTAMQDVGATVFPDGHPYHHSTIGSMKDLDAADLADVHAFYRQHYRPANTVLVLVGDLSAQEGFAAAERYFGALPATPRPPVPSAAALAPLREPVRLERRREVPNDRLYLAFRLPPEHTAEFLACSLALDIVGGLAISRLYRRLVRHERSATSISTPALGLARGVSLGMVIADISAGTEPREVERGICEELERLAAEGPTGAELEAARAQNERGWLSALSGQDSRADAIAHYATLYDDPGYVNTMLDDLFAVDAGQVRSAASTWLRPSARATIAYLTAEHELIDPAPERESVAVNAGGEIG